MEIYLVRHTTPGIEKGICYGQADIELAQTFLDEAKKVKRRLPVDAKRVYSSVSQRCHELAKLLFPDVVIEVNTALQEINCGDWELRRWCDIDPTELDHWMKNYEHVRYPGGENLREFRKRVLEIWQKIVNANASPVVIVTHAGVIRVILAKIKHWKEMEVDQYVDLSFGTVVHLSV